MDFIENIHTVPLRPNDFDWSRQLNNSVYLQLLETGRWSWALDNGIDLRESNIVGVVVRIEIDYLRPIFWNPISVLKVRTRVKNIERFSIYLHQSIEDENTNLIADAIVRLAMYDMNNRRVIPIDKDELMGLASK